MRLASGAVKSNGRPEGSALEQPESAGCSPDRVESPRLSARLFYSSLEVAEMPEAVLCKDCKQSINKEVDQYVVIEKGTDRYPETLAHVACEQKRAASGIGLDEWLRKLRWPAR